MPTGTQFRQTASALDVLGQASADARSDLFRLGSNTGVRGGTFATTIDRGLDTTAINLGSVTGRCLAEAAEARRRATLCDQYTAAIRNYHVRLSNWQNSPPEAPPTPRPMPPIRPAAWADAG